VGQPNPHLKGRSIPLEMGQGARRGIEHQCDGGGARGHKNDWDFFASESGETAWNYESRTQYLPPGWKTGGEHPTPRVAETGGLVFVQSAPDPNPIAPAMVDAARSIGDANFR